MSVNDLELRPQKARFGTSVRRRYHVCAGKTGPATALTLTFSDCSPARNQGACAAAPSPGPTQGLANWLLQIVARLVSGNPTIKRCCSDVGTARPGPDEGALPALYTARFGMICFLRLMMPGRTTLSPETSAEKDFSATVLTRSFGTSSVASSLRMSTTKSST